MAFTKLKLTTFGQTIEAKRHQGKGIKFTRVAIGDGLLGNGSMINRTELVSERHSMKIDGILTTDDGKQSVVVVTLDNSQFDEGFSYRELGLLAQDPDTQEEGVYLYDNAGAECEYLDTKDNGVVIYERLKLQIRVEQTENISFEASGNPLYLSAEDVEAMIQQHNTSADAHPNKADLDDDGKLVQDVDGGTWDTEPVEAHNRTVLTHTNLRVDGNSTAAEDGSATLEEHMVNPMAHQNLVIDGNAGK